MKKGIIILSLVAIVGIAAFALFKTLTHKNIHRKWVRNFMESFGGKKLSAAMEFLNDIEEYQK